MKATQAGAIAQVEELIQAGADLNRRNQDGNNV
jgi:ankyrin repeat protein